MWKRQINVKQTFVHLSTSVTFPTLVFKSIKGICCFCKKKTTKNRIKQKRKGNWNGKQNNEKNKKNI